MNKIYYDIMEHPVPMTQKSKNQIVIFIIKDYKHIPIVSFCFEDVMGDRIDQYEIYIENISIKESSNNKVTIQIDEVLVEVQCKEKNITSSYMIDPLGVMEKTESVKFEVSLKNELPNDVSLKSQQIIKKMLFNDYNYIEKTIIDKVETNSDAIEQLVAQVKKISTYITSFTSPTQ